MASICGFLLLIVICGDKLAPSHGLFLINTLKFHAVVIEAISEPYSIRASLNAYLCLHPFNTPNQGYDTQATWVATFRLYGFPVA